MSELEADECNLCCRETIVTVFVGKVLMLAAASVSASEFFISRPNLGH